MVISPKYKFAFIANPKTGSKSICLALLNDVKDKKLINEKDYAEKTSFNFNKHLPCPNLIKQKPQYKNYFKFAFVRNSWHRVVSWYFFEKRVDLWDPERNSSNISFEEFVSNVEFKKRVWGNENQFQYEFTKGCDFIGRTENLQSDFNAVCDKIGIPHQKLLHKNKTKHEHYTEYYDEKTKKIVAKVFKKDIKYFNFKFGE